MMVVKIKKSKDTNKCIIKRKLKYENDKKCLEESQLKYENDKKGLEEPQLENKMNYLEKIK